MWEGLNKPKVKFKDLKSEDARKVLLGMIREVMRSGVFNDCPLNLGAEATEEAIIELIDHGLLRIVVDGNYENFHIEVYHPQKKEYVSFG